MNYYSLYLSVVTLKFFIKGPFRLEEICCGNAMGVYVAQNRFAAYVVWTILGEFLKNGPTPASFSLIFGLFKQTIQFFATNQCEKCPNIHPVYCSGIDPLTFWTESSLLTTRPGLPPLNIYLAINCFQESGWRWDFWHSRRWLLDDSSRLETGTAATNNASSFKLRNFWKYLLMN